jgi:hypothetical protein
MTLPNLQLSLTEQKEIKNENTNTANASVINNIQIGNADKNTVQETTLKTSPSSSVLRTETPDNIRRFKETFMLILISYFKSNIILLNNLAELSEKIITKIDDLKQLISLLTEVATDNIDIVVEEFDVKNCCGMLCKVLPRYRKISDIIINKKQSFKVVFNQYFIQMGTEFNISLEFVLL